MTSIIPSKQEVFGPVGNGPYQQQDQVSFDSYAWERENQVKLIGIILYHQDFLYGLQFLGVKVIRPILDNSASVDPTDGLKSSSDKDDKVSGAEIISEMFGTHPENAIRTVFRFNEPDERIETIRVRSGAWIDGIGIETNKKSSDWLGGDGGDLAHFKLKPVQSLKSVIGTAGVYVGGIGFVVHEKSKSTMATNNNNTNKPTSPTSPTSPSKTSIPSPVVKNPHALQNDAENYKNTLLAYYKYMHQLPPQREWMRFKFGLKMRDIFDAQKNVNILGVGSGAGDVDIDFLNEIVTCGAQRCGETGYSVTYHVVEPNAENVQAFKNRVEHKPEYQRVKFQWYTGFFDQFVNDFKQKAKDEASKFHFVHFVRCFYHIDSRQAFDTTYHALLAKGGVMCGVGENEDAFWPRMMNFLAEHKMEHECFTCSGPVSQNYFLPGWLQQCRDRDWRYESYVQGYKFDITPMYDANNRDGNYILDFAMHIKDSRKNVDKTVIDDFFKFLEAHKKERIVADKDVQRVQVYYPCELGAIMITKD